MKIRLASFFALVAMVGLGFTMVSFTTEASNTTNTEIKADGDCNKCNDPKCTGTCDQEHKCTEECKKDGKCTHASADHKCTDACKKDGKCTHKAEASKTSSTPAKSCCSKKGEGAAKSCGPKKGCGKH